MESDGYMMLEDNAVDGNFPLSDVQKYGPDLPKPLRRTDKITPNLTGQIFQEFGQMETASDSIDWGPDVGASLSR